MNSPSIHSAGRVLLLIGALLAAIPAEGQQSTLEPLSRQTLRLQIALERSHFSPGILDAKPGPKLARALMAFQTSRSLPATGMVDPATAEALELSQSDPVTMHTVEPADLASVTGPSPKTWPAKARVKLLGYETAHEALAERFHCTRELLSRLNPGRDLNRIKPGETLIVPRLEAPASVPSITRLEVNQLERTIQAFGAADRVVALFHCSIAKDIAKRPRGEARVVVIAQDPTYNFDPKMWPEVKGVTQKLLIPPGPRNPVGKCWIGLNLKGYGIHGTPSPEMIGKTGSHGCIRLTNWDAQHLARFVTPGMRVTFMKG